MPWTVPATCWAAAPWRVTSSSPGAPSCLRLHRHHGNQLQRAPLGAQADCPVPGRTHHRRATRQSLSQAGCQRQERRQRDAAATCEAASRPQMHFVPVKSIEQQSMLCVHRLREGRARTQTVLRRTSAATRSACGSRPCASERAGTKPPWPWPTRTRASCGR